MKVIATGLVLFALSGPAFAQSIIVDPSPAFHFDLQWQSKSGGIPLLPSGLSGTWWRNEQWVKTLGLTTDQQKKMDEAFQQYRLKLIDLNASLEKEELILEPLVQSVRPEDQAKIMSQIDRVANARAELEKANARMLLGIRQVLTEDQWSKLPSVKAKQLKLYSTGNTLKIYK